MKKLCPKCNSYVEFENDKCPVCEKHRQIAPAIPKQKSLPLAIGLNFLLPGVGYMYMGKIIIGIAAFLLILGIYAVSSVFILGPVWIGINIMMAIDMYILFNKNKQKFIEATTTTCPFCAETIQKAAKICKHCGRELVAVLALVILFSASAWASRAEWVSLQFPLYFTNGAALQINKIHDDGPNIVVTVNGQDQTYSKSDVDFTRTLLSAAEITGKMIQKENHDQTQNQSASDAVEITNSVASWPEEGIWKIEGTVKNISDKPVSFVEIKAKVYSTNGAYLGNEECYSDPMNLGPGDEGTFRILSADKPKADTDSVKLTVEHQ